MTSISAKTGTETRAIAHVGVSLLELVNSTKLALGAAARAHDRRRASEAVGANTMRDTAMDPETASGHQAWQADLPFFMQSGFGKR